MIVDCEMISFKYLGQDPIYVYNEADIDNFDQKEENLGQLQQMDDNLYCINNPSQG